jgi:hypothetical protein
MRPWIRQIVSVLFVVFILTASSYRCDKPLLVETQVKKNRPLQLRLTSVTNLPGGLFSAITGD